MLPLYMKMRVMLLAAEYFINGESKSIIEHARQELLQDWRGLLDAGVGIDLDQPRIALIV